jgi:alpha-glucosidase (family GH31 glycosyl hydrolase)
MERRTFLKQSVIGIGTLAGIHSGILNAEGTDRDALASLMAGRGGAAIKGASPEVWGTNAAVLKEPWGASPSIDELLTDENHTLILNGFYRVGGDNCSATPTECRISYSNSALFVVFRCQESDISFPYANLDPDSWREATWRSLRGLPSASNNWPPYPDEVDFLIQPDAGVPSCYQFAATLQGLKFGCERQLSSSADVAPDTAAAARRSSEVANKIEDFEATVIRKTGEWLVFLQIPWQTLGGKPKSCFGFLPMRTRWRDGEFSSPAAIDFNEGMPVDLFIETHFSGDAQVQDPQSSLCRLPSGILRWQSPALLTYPGVDTCRQIWQMESSLTTPTDKNNLAQRLYLTQRWVDLVTQEGLVLYPRAWTDPRGWDILKSDMTLPLIRQKVNAALQKNDPAQAYQLLDTYLSQLDKLSRWWYADGSPGDILTDAWTPVTSAESLEVQGSTLLMRCMAGSHEVELRLVLPATGGVRIYGSEEGYWRPDGLLPLKATQTSGSCSIETADGKIVISQKPFSVSFYDASGNEVTEIGAGSLAFRFDQDGRILAIDFKNRLSQDEAIYGFGEKYDQFPHNGCVLTLWGTDDWVGNGEGLANTTYKALPIFHSSKGYMVFDNSSYRLRADIGKTDPNQYRITQQGPIFDYYFLMGAPEKTLPSYTALTGRVPLPPKWVFEPWMGRGGGAWAEGNWEDLEFAVSEEERVTLHYAELDIPHSAIYAEGPSALSPELNHFMADRGIRVLGYFMPADVPLRLQQRLMPELKPDQLPILRFPSGAIAPDLEEDNYIDFTNPNALELCRRALREALDLGQAGSMVDFGDLTPDDAVFYSGQRGAQMHNFYYYDYQRTVSEVYREKRGNDFILYARGAAPGTQHWVGQFAGDHPANFNGLKHVVTGAMNLCACGYSLWGSDLGGYFGYPQPAVYMRWFQFGCFSPLMRPHGTAPRDPWYFNEAAVTNYKFLAWTRENILNYTYNAAAIAHETGIPIMRSMPVAFPDEEQLAAVGDQYMFGPDLLVAPVVNEDTSRVIQFPSGTWTSLWDGKTISGPAKREISAPLDTIPVYLRPGAAVPVQLSRELQFGRSMTNSRVDVLVATPPNASRTVPLLNSRGEGAKVVVQLKPDHFIWTLTNFPEASYFLLYGCATASMVKVNGKVVPKSTAVEHGSMLNGWAADSAGNRLVIHLPSCQTEQSEPIMEIKVGWNLGKK